MGLRIGRGGKDIFLGHFFFVYFIQLFFSNNATFRRTREGTKKRRDIMNVREEEGIGRKDGATRITATVVRAREA